MAVMSRPALDASAALTRLSPGQGVIGLWVEPIYHRRGYSQALPEVWLRVQAVQRLLPALPTVLAEDVSLLLLDGWRPRELQKALWEEYMAKLQESSGLSGEALDRRAREFVSPPDTSEAPPAHRTGGAVDLTLCTLDGQAIDMGGEVDELSVRSHPGFYERVGLSADERRYRDRRRLLLRAMSGAGFWRLPTEWWHFEYGTRDWASHTGGQRRFGEAPPPPR